MRARSPASKRPERSEMQSFIEATPLAWKGVAGERFVPLRSITSRERSFLQRGIRLGTIVKYEDYGFPKTRYAYAVADGKPHQEVRESLRSLHDGTWTFVDVQEQVAKKLLQKLYPNMTEAQLREAAHEFRESAKAKQQSEMLDMYSSTIRRRMEGEN